jgi:tRNA pseudouridine38-40 synthase
MKYCLISIAYDESFSGFQVQPNVRTVQGEIMEKLKPIGIRKVVASSRTDSHVRASSNIIEVKYNDCQKVCKIIDSIRGIVVNGYIPSDQYVKLRGKVTKHYIYIHPEPLNQHSVNKAIDDFLSSNYSLFSKEPGKKVLLDSLRFRNSRCYSTFLFIGRSFSWNFVRISAENIIKRSRGEIDDEEWSELLQGLRKYRFKGGAENLILLKSDIGSEMIKFNSKNLNRIVETEIRKLHWLEGLGIDIDCMIPGK